MDKSLDLIISEASGIGTLQQFYNGDVLSILNAKKKLLELSLTNSQYAYLNSYLSEKKTSKELVLLFLSKLDDDSIQKLKEKIVKSTFKNKVLSLKILDGTYSTDEIVSYMTQHKNETRLFTAFWSLCGISYKDNFEKLIDEEVENVAKKNYDIAHKNDEEMIKSLNGKIKKLDSKIVKYDNQEKKMREDLEKSNVSQKNLKEDLEKKNEQIESLRKELEIQSKIVSNLPQENVIVESEKKETIKSEDTFSKSLTPDKILETLEKQYLIGVVYKEGIKLKDINGIVITPLVQILNDASYIDIKRIASIIDFRNEYSTFLAFNDYNLRSKVLTEEEINLYYTMDSAERYNIISRALIGKTIVFKPEFKTVNEYKEGTNKKKLNAVIYKVANSSDFQNAIFIPCLNITKTKFQEMIQNEEDFELEFYPISLYSTLKYVLVQKTIYEIDYIPYNKTPNDQDINKWRQNVKKSTMITSITIDDNSKEFILIKNESDEKIINGIYIKRVAIATKNSEATIAVFDETKFLEDVLKNTALNNLYYSMEDIKNFHIALKSSNLVILAGPSGIGKTRLPLMYASTLGLKNTKNSVLFVPISPSYIEPEDILGYLKPSGELKDGKMLAKYVESPTSLVSFLLDASKNADNIHIVIFDEMNLSQIEHWFAPFLSIMEQDLEDRKLVLFPEESVTIDNGDYPPYILINKNVFFIGTVNIDETTKSLSDRLLDRAIVINLKKNKFSDLKNMVKPINDQVYPEIKYSTFETSIKKKNDYVSEFNENELNLLQEISNLLSDSMIDKGISYRTLKKIAIFMSNSEKLLERELALDFAVSEMIISRITGGRDEIGHIFTDSRDSGITSILSKYDNLSHFIRSKELVAKKSKELNRYGYTN